MRCDRGQSTVEWVGLLLLVSTAVATLGAIAGLGLPGAALARAISGQIVCALSLSDGCGDPGPSQLATTYGVELAELVASKTPQVRYEPGMRAVPVDFRSCREDACADGGEGLRVASSVTGEPAVLFTRVIDCRPGSETAGADCAGDAAGNLYLQYWLYYPGSATGEGSIAPGVVRGVSDFVGVPSYHPDDWESVQVRLHSDGTAEMRASSHHGYGPGWRPADGAHYRVSGGSHAGTVDPSGFARVSPPRRLQLVPLEPISQAEAATSFAVTPPWMKRAWLEPEYDGTD